jgi:hypothetical protein
VSAIKKALNSNSATTPVDRIFSQNTSSPNFISVLLGRSDDPDNPWPGDITVGTVIEGYEAIQNQPKLTVPTAKSGNLHWSVVIDPDGIIGPNGGAVPVQTTVSSTKNSTQLTGFFDTGYVRIYLGYLTLHSLKPVGSLGTHYLKFRRTLQHIYTPRSKVPRS